MARWAKGQLQADLERISKANGVGLQAVNAAYTSQACPNCSRTERDNRGGQAFRCRRCGTAGGADAVAASNVLSRGDDPEITRYMPKADVKRVLDQRAADRAEALGLPPVMPAQADTASGPSGDHGAAQGMTTEGRGAESPAPGTA